MSLLIEISGMHTRDSQGSRSHLDCIRYVASVPDPFRQTTSSREVDNFSSVTDNVIDDAFHEHIPCEPPCVYGRQASQVCITCNGRILEAR